MNLSAFEKDILGWYASHTKDEVLRKQCLTAQGISREFSGTGQFTNLSVSKETLPSTFGLAPEAPFIKSPSLPLGATVDLWLKDGYLDFIEVVSLEGPFPEVLLEYQLCEPA